MGRSRWVRIEDPRVARLDRFERSAGRLERIHPIWQTAVLAPMNRDGGKKRGKRRRFGGR